MASNDSIWGTAFGDDTAFPTSMVSQFHTLVEVPMGGKENSMDLRFGAKRRGFGSTFESN